jgi:hypothetical protein
MGGFCFFWKTTTPACAEAANSAAIHWDFLPFSFIHFRLSLLLISRPRG